MPIDFLTGNIATLLDGDMQPAGDVEIVKYNHRNNTYDVWWTYEQTGENEMLTVDAWRLLKKIKVL